MTDKEIAITRPTIKKDERPQRTLHRGEMKMNDSCDKNVILFTFVLVCVTIVMVGDVFFYCDVIERNGWLVCYLVK